MASYDPLIMLYNNFKVSYIEAS